MSLMAKTLATYKQILKSSHYTTTGSYLEFQMTIGIGIKVPNILVTRVLLSLRILKNTLLFCFTSLNYKIMGRQLNIKISVLVFILIHSLIIIQHCFPRNSKFIMGKRKIPIHCESKNLFISFHLSQTYLQINSNVQQHKIYF